MRVDVGRHRGSCPRDQQVSRIFNDDMHAALGSEDIFNEECDLADLRTPGGLVPAHRSVIEYDLELTVIVHLGRNLVGQASANGMHTNRLRAGHMAHHIHIVYAAIHDGR